MLNMIRYCLMLLLLCIYVVCIGGTHDQIIYSDLNQDPALFEGDPSVDFQYEVYRLMKRLVADGTILEGQNSKISQKDGVNWKAYCPKTNALWIWYLVERVLVKKLLELPGKRSTKKHAQKSDKATHPLEVIQEKLLRWSQHLWNSVIVGNMSLWQFYLDTRESFLNDDTNAYK